LFVGRQQSVIAEVLPSALPTGSTPVEVARKAVGMPTHGVQRQTDKRNVASECSVLSNATFGAGCENEIGAFEHDLRAVRFTISLGRAPFHHGVDRVAGLLVQLVEFASARMTSRMNSRQTARVVHATALDTRAANTSSSPSFNRLFTRGSCRRYG